jgi:hypothetical protein
LNYKPVLSSERAPLNEEQSNCPAKERKKKNLIIGCLTPRRIGQLTVGHKINSASSLGAVQTINRSIHGSPDLQGSSVASKEARTDCIAGVNKVVH